MQEKIIELFHEVLELTGKELLAPIENDLVLLESGMDSLGFAILIARLEEELGFDPFIEMDSPFYPRTLGEFISVYKNR